MIDKKYLFFDRRDNYYLSSPPYISAHAEIIRHCNTHTKQYH